MPGTLGRNFTIEPIYDAGPFKVRTQSKRVTVGEVQAIRGRVVDHKDGLFVIDAPRPGRSSCNGGSIFGFWRELIGPSGV